MDKYNNSEKSETSSNNTDREHMINSSSSQTETKRISLEKNSNQNQTSNHQNLQNDANHIDGFPLQGSQDQQNGDFVTPGYNNSNYNNTNYISQDSISSND